jgi:hypothetical protein
MTTHYYLDPQKFVMYYMQLVTPRLVAIAVRTAANV